MHHDQEGVSFGAKFHTIQNSCAEHTRGSANNGPTEANRRRSVPVEKHATMVTFIGRGNFLLSPLERLDFKCEGVEVAFFSRILPL